MELIEVDKPIVEKDPYYFRSEISNSDLSELAKYWLPENILYDIEAAYRFGTLIDCMITEAEKINYYKFTCAGVQYTMEEFELAKAMKASFWADEFCKIIASHSEMQKIIVVEDFRIEYDGFSFTLPMRCKFDLYALPKLGMTGDIKSTTAKTTKQFIAACHHFGYFRQRAVYMDLSGSNKDILIGISKENNEVFKVPIIRGSELYNIGKAQYQELAWQMNYLFGDMSNVKIIEPLKIAI